MDHEELFLTDSNPSFFNRIALAFGTFYAMLSNDEFAGRVQRFRQAMDLPQTKVAEGPKAPTRPLKETLPEAALQLLGLLQREARFVDFIEEDVTAYSDADSAPRPASCMTAAAKCCASISPSSPCGKRLRGAGSR
jgi:hypothetical protein